MGEVIQIVDKRKARPALGHPDAARHVDLRGYAGMTSDRALLSIAQEGIRLSDLAPAQKATVAGWMRNEAGKAFHRLQSRGLSGTARAALEEMRAQMIAKAEAIEAQLPAPEPPEMETQVVRLTREEFAAVAAGRYPAGRMPVHGPPRVTE